MKLPQFNIQVLAVVGCVALAMTLSRCSPLYPSGYKGVAQHTTSGLPAPQNNLNYIYIYQPRTAALPSDQYSETVDSMPSSQKEVVLSAAQIQDLHANGHTEIQLLSPPPKGSLMYFSVNVGSDEIDSANLNSVQVDVEPTVANSWRLTLPQTDAARALQVALQGATLTVTAAPSMPIPAPVVSVSPSPSPSPSPAL